MIDLFDVLLLMLFTTACAWLWRGHGIRERALLLAQQHCERLNLEFLDGAVALRRLAWRHDARGRKRLARLYDFEFTVTGEQRLHGSISMFGQQLGQIELAPHPFPQTAAEQGQVIELEQWRSNRRKVDEPSAD